MSSGFVSAGTNEQPIERDDEWLKAQQELEEERRRKAEIGKQDDGKSLFEVLERNKMAKQEAFEEKARLKNQFRSLDEDEVEFLDSVLESTRAQEAAVKRDTADQLELFRRQREEAEKALLGPTSSDVTPAEEEEWTAPARKRRRDKQKDLLIPGKKRKASLTENKPQEQGSQKSGADSGSNPKQAAQQDRKPQPTASPIPKTASTPSTATKPEQGQPQKPPTKPAPISLGLAGYSSDSE